MRVGGAAEARALAKRRFQNTTVQRFRRRHVERRRHAGELFDDVQREARLSEISKRLDLPASSASMLLHSLVQLGYLSHDRVLRTFRPTPRIGMLGSWTTGALTNDGWFARMLQELSSRTGETISIAARNGIYAQYIRVVQATNALRIHVPTGTRRLLVLTATAALGRWEEFRLHVRTGLAHELEPCDLREVLLQLAVYAGVPAANAAFHIASELLDQEPD